MSGEDTQHLTDFEQGPGPVDLREKVRAAISDAYYDARNAGGTMEDAADSATNYVLGLVADLVDDLDGAKRLNTDLLATLPVEDTSRPVPTTGPKRSFLGFATPTRDAQPAEDRRVELDSRLRERQLDEFMGWLFRDGGLEPPRREYDAVAQRLRLLVLPLTTPELTHGRHCPCSACARQDWTDPTLAHCGMHGPSCPAVYDPWIFEALSGGSVDEERDTDEP